VKIDIKFDTSNLDKTIPRYQKNLAYSTAQALRAVGLEAQKRIRENLRIKFHVRKTDFMNRTIKIFAFPSVGTNRPYLEIGIDNKAKLLLSIYEQGGTRGPFKGKNVAVPRTGFARPSVESSVRADLTFQALNFQRGPIKKTGAAIDAWARQGIAKKRGIRGKLANEYFVWQGNQRTFILFKTARAPLGGVFQRVGPKREDIRMIYSFKQAIQLRAVLEFIKTAEQTFDHVYREAFYKAFYRIG